MPSNTNTTKGKPKDYVQVFPKPNNKLAVIIRHANKLAVGEINLKEDYTCKYGCSHWNTDYCECKCHDKIKNAIRGIKWSR